MPAAARHRGPSRMIPVRRLTMWVPARLTTGGGPRPATARLISIRRDAGVLDDLGPERDVGLDDVGELRPRRALRLASGDVELLANIRCRKGRFQRLADAIDDRLGRARRHHDA